VKLLLKNGRVVDPASSVDETLDLLIEKGKVSRLDRRIEEQGVQTVDLTGMVVAPGFIDMHVHLREPGQEWKETVASGTAAAASGGFTGVACMANTLPVNDSRSVTELIMTQAAEHGTVPVYPIGAVTKGLGGEELAEMDDMREAGARAFSDDGKPVYSSLMMRKALEYSKIFDLPIIDHCEDTVLVDGGVMNEGETSTRLGLRGWPSVAEDIMVQRDILLSEYTGGHVHIAHISTARAVEFVRRAKRRKIRVTCEVTPHHFALDETAVGEYDTDAKMNPPLRAKDDGKAMLKGLADGTIDAIATDHAPHHCDEKCVEFSTAPFGVIGLETALPVTLDRLVNKGKIGLERMIELYTTGPARILRLDKGTLRKGADADITVLDLNRRTTIDPEGFRSKSRNTPFRGWELRGAPVMTIVAGKIVHDARKPIR
jgi:dihydroorotase